MNRQKFEIYRPAVHRQRLEGQYHTPPPNVWTPSTTYKAQLAEIKMQFTPAQAYKHRLQTTGKEACYRGFKGRQYFKSVRNNLLLQRRRKDCKHFSTKHFREGNKLEALKVLGTLSFEEKTSEIRMITLRTLYGLRMFPECERECDRVLRIDKFNEDAHYMKACSLVSRAMYQEAYSALRVLFSTFTDPDPESYRLNGLVSMRVDPPRYEEAVESFSTLVYKRPEDMNALLLRANAFACTQSFREAIDDVDIILKFQLNLPNALYMRARLNCCLREYAEAKNDIFQLEKTAGVHNEYYIYGAMEVGIVSDDLPMLDEATRAEAENTE